MADKNFGVKKLNLIGASGTPSIDSPNNLNINAINVAISTDLTIGGEINSNIKVGSAYSVGIGTTNPTSKLHVIGDGYFSGSINAESFTGIASTAVTAYNLLDAANILSGTISTERLTGEYDIDISGKSKDVVGGIASLTSLNVSGISTLGNILISAGIVTAVNGVATYYGDGSKLENLNLAGAGISIYNNNNLLGVASAINFIEYIDVEFGGTISTISANKDAINYFKLSDVGIHTLSNVGIGTTNATNTLTVVGTVTATDYYGDGSTLDNIVYVIQEETVPITTTDIEINWLDTYGDGWNGGLVDVYVDNVLVVDDFTIPDVGDNITTGISTLTNVSAGSTIKIERVALGEYPEEMTISSIVISGAPAGASPLLQNFNFTSVGIETVFITVPSSYAIIPTSDGQDGESRFNHYTNTLEYHDGTSWNKPLDDITIKNDTNIVSHTLTTGEGGCNNIFLGIDAGKSHTTGNNNNFLGYNAGRNTNNGSYNNFFGFQAGFCNTTGNNNNFFGFRAGCSNDVGRFNNFIGSETGLCNTSGCFNNFFGNGVGRFNTTGKFNNFIGYRAGYCNTTGNYNNFFGNSAGFSNTTGTYNNFLGFNAGYRNTTGGNNNFLGFCAGYFNTTGCYNNFFGNNAGNRNTTGSDNNFLGQSAGYCNTTGSSNNFIGNSAGRSNISGSCNNFFGCRAGYNNTAGFYNNFLGSSAGYANTTGCHNNFFGYFAGYCNTTGNYNNFFGNSAGFSNTTGYWNNFFGRSAGYCNTTGCYNNFFGRSAGFCNTTGCFNNFLGFQAGFCNTTGTYNNFLGRNTGYDNTTGCRNNFLGYYAGRSNTTGRDNNFVGYRAGCCNTTGSNNNFLGYQSGCTQTSGDNNVAIGYSVQLPNTTGSTQLAIGAGNTTWINGDENFNVGIGTTNPQYKLDVGGSIKISDRIYDSNDSSGSNNQVLTSGGPSGVWTWKDLGAVGNANISILDQGSVLGSFSVIDYVGSNISATGIGSTAIITFTDSPTFTNLNVTGVSTFQSDVYLGDDDRLYFGGGNDLEIYHNSAIGRNYIDSHSDLWIRSRVAESDIYISAYDDLFLRVSDGENAIVATGGGSVKLYYDNFNKFETTGIGVSISNGGTNTATITGPANLIIDPATVNDNTGVVRIKGDLYVDGTTTQINSTTIELADFIVGIATTATTDLLADGAGIQIGPDNTLLYDYNGGTDSSLKSSENLNVAANKGYQVDGTLVLNSTTLGSTVVNSSLTNVGILTGLSVNGDVYIQQNNTLYFDSSSDASLYYNQTSESLQLSLGSNANDFRISDGGNERFRFVKSTGNLGVGLTNPTEKIDVNGNVKAIDFNTTSDRNLKDNIQIIENPIEKLTQINGVSFEWKKDQKQSIGVIAQEIEKVFPELVSGDDVKTVNYNGLIGVLIECVKKQQEEIEDLKQRVYKY